MGCALVSLHMEKIVLHDNQTYKTKISKWYKKQFDCIKMPKTKTNQWFWIQFLNLLLTFLFTCQAQARWRDRWPPCKGLFQYFLTNDQTIPSFHLYTKKEHEANNKNKIKLKFVLLRLTCFFVFVLLAFEDMIHYSFRRLHSLGCWKPFP